MAWLGSAFIAVGAALTVFAPTIKKRDDRRRAARRIRAGFPHVVSIVIFGLMLIVIGIVTLGANG